MNEHANMIENEVKVRHVFNMIENEVKVRYVFTIRTENNILSTITYDFSDYQIYSNNGERKLIEFIRKIFGENVYIIRDLFVVDYTGYPGTSHLELVEYKHDII